jgi:hypothetical protein
MTAVHFLVLFRYLRVPGDAPFLYVVPDLLQLPSRVAPRRALFDCHAHHPDLRNLEKLKWGAPGFEPGTPRIQSENPTTRPCPYICVAEDRLPHYIHS